MPRASAAASAKGDSVLWNIAEYCHDCQGHIGDVEEEGLEVGALDGLPDEDCRKDAQGDCRRTHGKDMDPHVHERASSVVQDWRLAAA